MDIQDVINDTNYSVRTQISLSPSLYRMLKQRAKKEERSIAALIRESVVNSIKSDSEKKENRQKRLMELTEEIRTFAGSGKSGWAKVKNPHKLIRKWRREEDEHWMKKVGLKP